MREIKIDNFIGVVDGFFTAEECEEAIRRFKLCEEHGLTVNRQKSENSALSEKSDSQLFFDEARCSDYADALQIGGVVQRLFNERFWGNAYQQYSSNYDVIQRSGSHSIFQMKLQKTEIGEGYHLWHYESSERDSCNRLLSFILYLNDVEDGGETEFLYQHRRVKPSQGTLVIFPAAFTHTHRGNPPLSNSKYIITGWVEF